MLRTYFVALSFITLLNSAFSQNVISPEKFGAIGNGLNDDTDALTKALSYCEMHQTTLKLGTKKSVYLISKPLTIRNKIILLGPGILKKTKNANFVLLTVLASDVTLDGIGIDGNLDGQKSLGVNNGDLRIVNSNKVKLLNNTLRNSAGNAIALFNSASCLISNNTIYNAHDNAILVADGASNDNIIERNDIDKTITQNGIFITASSGSVKTTAHVMRNIIRNNTIKNSADIGIESSIHADGTLIYGNKIYHSKNDHIIIRDNVNNIVSNNYCYQTGKGTGIAISVLDLVGGVKDYNCKIENNQVVNAQKAGILIAGNNVEARNNKLGGVKTGDGIGISVQKDRVTLENNFIDGFGTGIKEFVKIGTKKYRNNKISNAVIKSQLMTQ